MKTFSLLAAAVFAAALAASASPAQAKTLKECAAEWDKMKAASQTGGVKKRDFTKQRMSGAAPATAAPAAPGRACASDSSQAHDRVGRPPGHDRPRARLRGGMEVRQGGRENPGRNEMAAILERVRQAQEGARDLTGQPRASWP